MADTWKLSALSGKRWAAWLGLVVAVLVAIAWQNGLRGPLVFDDLTAIVHSPNVRRPASFWEAAWGPPGSGANSRPLVALSLAANHAAGGLDPFGYHLVNVIAHALCAMVLGDLARRLSKSPGFGLALAAVWCVHPLTTDAVNLVVTRNEVFVALFGLLCLDAAWIHFESSTEGSRRAATLALGMGLLAALSKEIAAVLPLLCALMLLALSEDGAVRKHQRFLLGLLAVTWLPLALLVIFGERGASVGLDLPGLTSFGYLIDQGFAWLGYPLKTLLPTELLADYGPWPQFMGKIQGSVAYYLVVPVLLLGVVTLQNDSRALRSLGFLIVAFALWLAPSSTLLPLAGEIYAEHRAYLPSVSVLAIVLGFGRLLLLRAPKHLQVPFGGLLTLALCTVFVPMTRARNTVWQDELTFWEDVIEKSDHTRGWNSYGVALSARGRKKEAEEAYRHVLELDPEHAKANNNLGNLLSVADPLAAEGHFRAALLSDPDNVEAKTNLANLLRRTNRFDEAFEAWDEALSLNPNSTPTLLNRGEARIALGQVREGLEDLERAHAVDPSFQAVRARLAWHLAVAPEEDLRDAQRALDLVRDMSGGPRVGDAHAAALAALGYDTDAVRVATGAAELARRRGQTQLAQEIESRAALYREGRSYVQER